MKKLTKEQFIEKSNLRHNHRYDYSNSIYINRRTSISIYCPVHKEIFTVNPRSHWLEGTRCEKCFNDDRLEKYLKDIKEIHNNKYDYSLVEFKYESNFKIKIICPYHDVFEQDAWNHFNGQGCPKCASLTIGYSYTNFKKSCDKNNNGLGILYILRCFNETELFYKVGITSLSIKARYDSKQRMPYDYEIVQEISDIPKNIWELEKYLKRYSLQNNLRYTPKIYFCGQQTECYQI